MPGKKRILAVLAALPFLIYMSSPEEGHAGGSSAEFIGKTINFIILFGGLAILLAKPLRRYLEGRSAEVRKILEESLESRERAEDKLREVRVRLEALEGEVDRIRRQAEEAGLLEKERIMQLARDEAERVKSLAEQEMAFQVREGIKELKRHAAGLATALAEERIRARLTPDAQTCLIDKTIEKLEELHAKPDLG